MSRFGSSKWSDDDEQTERVLIAGPEMPPKISNTPVLGKSYTTFDQKDVKSELPSKTPMRYIPGIGLVPTNDRKTQATMTTSTTQPLTPSILVAGKTAGVPSVKHKSPPRVVDDWGTVSDEVETEDISELQKAINKDDVDTVNRLLKAGAEVTPDNFTAPDVRTRDSIKITLLLVDAASFDTLLEAMWYGDNHYRLLSISRMLKSAPEEITSKLYETPQDYAEVGVFFGNQAIIDAFAPFITNPIHVRMLLDLAVNRKHGNILAALITNLNINLKDHLMWNEDNEELSAFIELLTKYKALLKGTPYEQQVDNIISDNTPYYSQLKGKFMRWSTRNELAINLHIKPDCGECSKELEVAYDMIKTKGNEAYIQAKKEIASKQKAELKINLLNDSDFVGNDYEDFYNLAIIILPLPNSDKGYWFSVYDFDTILDKKKNPYTNAAVDGKDLDMIIERIAVLKSMNVDYKKLVVLSETLDILTNHKKYSILPGEAEVLRVKDTPSQDLAKILNAYYDADVFNSVSDNKDSLDTLSGMINESLGLRIPPPLDKNKIYTSLVNYIKIDQGTRAAAALTVFADYFQIFNR